MSVRIKDAVIYSGMCLLMSISIHSIATASSIKEGSHGSQVVELQRDLAKLGLFSGPTNGRFGPITKSALLSFQKSAGLKPDGVAGPRTISAIKQAMVPKEVYYTVASGDSLWLIAKAHGISVADLIKANNINENAKLDVGDRIKVPSTRFVASRGIIRSSTSAVVPLPWSSVTSLFRTTATVTDVKTGLTVTVKRRGGTYHADVEPVSQADTLTLKKIYGGHWSWSRRAVIVRIGTKAIAGSINGMPHGGELVSGNGFNGHFCLHFLGSRIHKTGAIDPEHQAMVRLASRQ